MELEKYIDKGEKDENNNLIFPPAVRIEKRNGQIILLPCDKDINRILGYVSTKPIPVKPVTWY